MLVVADSGELLSNFLGGFEDRRPRWHRYRLSIDCKSYIVSHSDLESAIHRISEFQGANGK
jgi:hypothetical protein